MLDPHDRWVWDFWHIHHGGIHHLYYLQARKSLGDPELRHRNATIGHATSMDLTTWTEHGTILRPGGPGTLDASATWTGSVVRGDDGMWRMFYTGSTFVSPDSTANIETIALAVSPDLYHWEKDHSFSLHADPTWYEKLGDTTWPEEAWRDPWVYRGGDGTWHMLITARSRSGATDDRGVIGHAHSEDLSSWTIDAPLTHPGAGFAQLEVLQHVTVDEHDFVVFSAHRLTLTEHRRSSGGDTGTWAAPAGARIRLDEAATLTDSGLYSGRIVDSGGTPVLLAFRTTDGDGNFLGGVIDPLPVVVRDGRLQVSRSPSRVGTSEP